MNLYKKIIGIGGLPCTGKSTLMKKLIIGDKIKKYKSLLLTDCGNYNILGHYKKKFGGTDVLCMNIQPIVCEYLLKTKKDVIFEGDRLFNGKFIEWIFKKGLNGTFIILNSKPEIISNRHIKRKDTQTEKWLKSRQTKIENIKKKFNIIELNNNTEDDLENNYNYIKGLL